MEREWRERGSEWRERGGTILDKRNDFRKLHCLKLMLHPLRIQRSMRVYFDARKKFYHNAINFLFSLSFLHGFAHHNLMAYALFTVKDALRDDSF